MMKYRFEINKIHLSNLYHFPKSFFIIKIGLSALCGMSTIVHVIMYFNTDSITQCE